MAIDNLVLLAIITSILVAMLLHRGMGQHGVEDEKAFENRIDANTDWLANPKPIDYGIGLLIGVLLLWVASRIRRGNKQEKQQTQVEQLTPLKAFGIGAVINIIGLPFALPYFAALDQILKADRTVTDSVIVITGYNLGYALPFLLVPVLALALGDRSRPVLARINEKVDRVSAFLMPLMLALVGIALVVDAIRFFAVSKGLF